MESAPAAGRSILITDFTIALHRQLIYQHLMRHFVPLLAILLLGAACTMPKANAPLDGKIICIDAGHGGTADTDDFRVGPTGEREEWINLRVALELHDLLKDAGARVVMTRTSDMAVGLKERADLAQEKGADLFLSLHHNATADRSVNFPIIYYGGAASENKAGVLLARLVGEELRAEMFGGLGALSICSDHTIFPSAGASVLRHSYGIPGVIGEASFFSNAEEEERLKEPGYNRREAEAYARAVKAFFRHEPLPIEEKGTLVNLPPFLVAQEAERMNEEALQWRENYLRGKEALLRGEAEEALRLLTLSVRSFPDSPDARESHFLRAEALDILGRGDEADEARVRAREYYGGI